MQAQVDIGEVCGGRLGIGARAFYGASNAAPEVRLPLCLAGCNEIVVLLIFERLVEVWLVRRKLGARGAGIHADGRVIVRAIFAHRVDGSAILLILRLEGLIRNDDRFFELVQFCVAVDLPPLAAKFVIAGLCAFPAAIWRIRRRCDFRSRCVFPEGRSGGCVRLVIVRADGAACKGKQRHACQRNFQCVAGFGMRGHLPPPPPPFSVLFEGAVWFCPG